MAHKRMFSKDITSSDAFREMPTSSQALYFHLGMEADDDGFLDNYKGLMRAVNATEDDLRILIAKRFLILFPSKVVVVKHWLINNTIRKDRYNETKHLEEKRALIVKENGSYTDDLSGLPSGNQMATQYRIEEDRIEENGELEDELRVEKVLESDEDRPKRQRKVTKEMQAVFDVFDDNPARKIWKLHEVQRESAATLFEEYGIDEVRNRYTVARAYRGSEMCPLINTPLDLLTKMPNMENFLKSLQS